MQLKVLAVLLASPAMAQVTPDELRDLACAGDVEAIAAALAESHLRYQAGEITGEDLRDLSRPLQLGGGIAWDVVDAWLAAEPDSPYALTLRAQQLDARAWDLRGTGSGRETAPEALQGFATMKQEAQDLARRAFRAAPDYLPASDILLAAGAVDLGPEALDATRDRGTLIRWLAWSPPWWGGGGIPEMEAICSMFAQYVETPGPYVERVCLADAIAQYQMMEGFDFAVSVLSANDDPWLATARLDAATIQPVEDGDRWIRDGLGTPGIRPEQRLRAAIAHDVMYYGEPPQFDRVWAEVSAEAEANLSLYPSDVTSLRVLLWTEGVAGAAWSGPDPTRREELLRAWVVAAPYDGHRWLDLAYEHLRRMTPFEAPDPELWTQAALWSADRRSVLDQLLDDYALRIQLIGWPPEMVPPELSHGTQAERDAFVDAMACRMVRVERLAADQPCLSPGQCPAQSRHPMVRRVIDGATERGLCDYERSAPVGDLVPTEDWPLAADRPAD